MFTTQLPSLVATKVHMRKSTNAEAQLILVYLGRSDRAPVDPAYQHDIPASDADVVRRSAKQCGHECARWASYLELVNERG